MDIAKVVDIALASCDGRRVEVAAIEPTSIEMEAVGGLSQLVAELVDNAVAFSDPDRQVRVTGLHDQEDYLLSISDRGVGIPEHLMVELNRMLADPGTQHVSEPRLGIALVARLAARHGIGVQLVPGAPGTTARVTIPSSLVGEPEGVTPVASPSEKPEPKVRVEGVFTEAHETALTVDLTRFEQGYRVGSGVVAMTDAARQEAEVFLEKVFAPLVEAPGRNGEPGAFPAAPAPEPEATVTALKVRVPGENFALTEDEPSTVAAEGAIDIRSALSSYQQGRRSATEQSDA